MNTTSGRSSAPAPRHERDGAHPETDTVISLGSWTRTLRTHHNHTRREAERLTGISRDYLKDIENGLPPSQKYLQNLIDGYRLDTAQTRTTWDLWRPPVHLPPATELRERIRTPARCDLLDRLDRSGFALAYLDPSRYGRCLPHRSPPPSSRCWPIPTTKHTGSPACSAAASHATAPAPTSTACTSSYPTTRPSTTTGTPAPTSPTDAAYDNPSTCAIPPPHSTSKSPNSPTPPKSAASSPGHPHNPDPRDHPPLRAHTPTNERGAAVRDLPSRRHRAHTHDNTAIDNRHPADTSFDSDPRSVTTHQLEATSRAVHSGGFSVVCCQGPRGEAGSIRRRMPLIDDTAAMLAIAIPLRGRRFQARLACRVGSSRRKPAGRCVRRMPPDIRAGKPRRTRQLDRTRVRQCPGRPRTGRHLGRHRFQRARPQPRSLRITPRAPVLADCRPRGMTMRARN